MARTVLDESRGSPELDYLRRSLEGVELLAICFSETVYLLSLVFARSLRPTFPGLDPVYYPGVEANYWLEKWRIDDRECGSWHYSQKGHPGRSVDRKDRYAAQVLTKPALSTA